MKEKFSTHIGELIGEGGTAKVHHWQKNEVIKIFKSTFPLHAIETEKNIGLLLNKTNLNLPKLIQSIDYLGDTALIYEFVPGKPLGEVLLTEENVEKSAKKFAEIHYLLHQNDSAKLPSQKKQLEWYIAEMKHTLGTKLKAFSDFISAHTSQNQLCHGDYHPLNILIDGDKYSVIDWNGCSAGNPLIDVSWTHLTLNSPAIAPQFGQEMADKMVLYATLYLKFYCEMAKIETQEVLKFHPISALRRLSDNINNKSAISMYENEWLLEKINSFAPTI